MSEILLYARIKTLIQELDISRTSFARLAKTDGFPKPVNISDGVTLYRRHDIERWKALKLEEKSDTQ